MATWQEQFKDKLITMDEAAWKIDSGDRLFVGETVSIPYNFLNALKFLKRLRSRTGAGVTVYPVYYLFKLSNINKPPFFKFF